MPRCSIGRDGVEIRYELLEPLAGTQTSLRDCAVVTLGGRRGIASARSFARDLATALGLPVLVWDRRNTLGSSLAFTAVPHVPEDAEDLHALLSKLKLNAVVLFGSSSGARVSALYMLKYGAEVKVLVLAPPTGGDAVNQLSDEYYIQPMETVKKSGMRGLLAIKDFADIEARNELLDTPVETFVAHMEASIAWLARYHEELFIGLTQPQILQLAERLRSKQIVVIHDGSVRDKLHTPKTSIGVARALGAASVQVVPGLFKWENSDVRIKVIAIVRQAFSSGPTILPSKI